MLIEVTCALVLAVTFYALTREEDAEIALLGLVFRLTEGVLGAMAIGKSVALLWLVTNPKAQLLNVDAAHALGLFLLRNEVPLIATFFALGSTCFTYLLLRGRMVPASLARLGLGGSVVLVLVLPLALVGVARGMVANLIWLPMLIFELWIAWWLIMKGAAAPARLASATATSEGRSR